MSGFLPQKQDKDVISIRIPVDLLKQVDENAALFDLSRNEFINQCITYAIANLEKPVKEYGSGSHPGLFDWLKTNTKRKKRAALQPVFLQFS